MNISQEANVLATQRALYVVINKQHRLYSQMVQISTPPSPFCDAG